MQRDVIRLQFNEPVRIRLDRGPEGTQKPSRYGGVDYMYTVNGGAASLYLPPQGRQALFQCGAQAGDEVAIRKSRRGNVEMFDAEVIPPNGHNGHNPPNGGYHPPNGHDSAPTNRYPENPPNGSPSRLMPSAEYYQQPSGRRSMPLPSDDHYQPRNPIPVQRSSNSGYSNGNHPSPSPRPIAVDRPAQSPSHLASCLRAAIDAAADAAEYAREKGMGITFLGSDIRAMANCLKIGDDRREAA
jgi:hypothetical protein